MSKIAHGLYICLRSCLVTDVSRAILCGWYLLVTDQASNCLVSSFSDVGTGQFSCVMANLDHSIDQYAWPRGLLCTSIRGTRHSGQRLCLPQAYGCDHPQPLESR
ncbi:hypothetical protein BDV97DRAFT_27826 [Delphinella strobiligena]|nr:hypothetical protein BDV97DRAFT_27826 [Delphinella strobiligena]